jgi:hypothetical protein
VNCDGGRDVVLDVLPGDFDGPLAVVGHPPVSISKSTMPAE